MKPKAGQTVIATEDCNRRYFKPYEEYKVVEVRETGYFVLNKKYYTGRFFILDSNNWPIKQEKRDYKRICGVVALVLMVIGVLLYRLLK